MLKRFLKNRSGATAIEYSILVASIALVLALGFTRVGDGINFLFMDNASKLREVFPNNSN